MPFFTLSETDYEIEGADLSQVRNVTEKLVIEALRETVRAPESVTLCRCATCLEDMYALALNSLPPQYLQSTGEAEYLERQSLEDSSRVKAAVSEAVRRVQARPNH